MLPYEDRHTVPAAIIIAAGLAVGLAAGGWLVGQGLARFKSETRTVTVKGLVEREVRSDQAVWTLGLRRASDTLGDAHQRIAADREAVLAFLKKQGFAAEKYLAISAIDRSMWKQEMPLHRELFDKLGARVPAVMRQRFEALAGSLG